MEGGQLGEKPHPKEKEAQELQTHQKQQQKQQQGCLTFGKG